MIKNFSHKGLELFFTKGSTKGIESRYAKKIARVLTQLNGAAELEDMNYPGARLHQYKGKRKGVWSVDVSGNYRITFTFKNGHAYNVNYEDPH